MTKVDLPHGRAMVIDAWHFLGEGGSLPSEPPRKRRLALRMARFIESGGNLARARARAALVECRNRPKGKACAEGMWVAKNESGEIEAFCPTCGRTEMIIHNWQGTKWAAGTKGQKKRLAVIRKFAGRR